MTDDKWEDLVIPEGDPETDSQEPTTPDPGDHFVYSVEKQGMTNENPS